MEINVTNVTKNADLGDFSPMSAPKMTPGMLLQRFADRGIHITCHDERHLSVTGKSPLNATDRTLIVQNQSALIAHLTAANDISQLTAGSTHHVGDITPTKTVFTHWTVKVITPAGGQFTTTIVTDQALSHGAFASRIGTPELFPIGGLIDFEPELGSASNDTERPRDADAATTVSCAAYQHFQRDMIGDGSGIGTCASGQADRDFALFRAAVDAWESRGHRGDGPFVSPPLYPDIERFCDGFKSHEDDTL